MLPGGDQAGDVGHIDHEFGSDVLGDLAHAREVDGPRVGGRPGDDKPGPVLLGEALELVVVDELELSVDAVAYEAVELGGEVDGTSMGEVSAVVEAHSQHGVAGTQRGEIGGHVGLGAAVGLNISVLGAEQLLRAPNRQALRDVDELASAVVATARVPLGVLVREDGALCLKHGSAGVVFRCDQVDSVALAFDLAAYSPPHLGVLFHQRAHVAP